MASTFNVLVVANRTADSPQLLEALRARAARGPVRFTLVAPASGGREAASRRLAAGVESMRAAGLEVDGRVGDPLPIHAVADAWDPRKFDEIVVSTLAPAQSKWLAADLPHRVARLTDASVTHVAAREPRRPPAPAPVERREQPGMLEALFYGGVASAPPRGLRPRAAPASGVPSQAPAAGRPRLRRVRGAVREALARRARRRRPDA